jgi:hypothetical protein
MTMQYPGYPAGQAAGAVYPQPMPGYYPQMASYSPIPPQAWGAYPQQPPRPPQTSTQGPVDWTRAVQSGPMGIVQAAMQHANPANWMNMLGQQFGMMGPGTYRVYTPVNAMIGNGSASVNTSPVNVPPFWTMPNVNVNVNQPPPLAIGQPAANNPWGNPSLDALFASLLNDLNSLTNLNNLQTGSTPPTTTPTTTSNPTTNTPSTSNDPDIAALLALLNEEGSSSSSSTTNTTTAGGDADISALLALLQQDS